MLDCAKDIDKVVFTALRVFLAKSLEVLDKDQNKHKQKGKTK